MKYLIKAERKSFWITVNRKTQILLGLLFLCIFLDYFFWTLLTWQKLILILSIKSQIIVFLEMRPLTTFLQFDYVNSFNFYKSFFVNNNLNFAPYTPTPSQCLRLTAFCNLSFLKHCMWQSVKVDCLEGLSDFFFLISTYLIKKGLIYLQCKIIYWKILPLFLCYNQLTI